MSHTIRFATPSDCGVILTFIRHLAEYERLSDECVATEDQLEGALFGERRYAEVLLLHEGETPAGFALFFHNFSTFLGKPGIYLEDLFVEPAFRGKGYGKALFAKLGELARERGCGRLEWAVLNWNEPAIAFYKSLGAESMSGWTVNRLAGVALDALGVTNGRTP